MISTAVPIAVLAVASLASAQPTMPSTNAATPASPLLMQLTPASMSGGTQVTSAGDAQVVISAGGAKTISGGGRVISMSASGQAVSMSSSGQSVSTSSGGKAVTITSSGQAKDELFAGTEKFAQGASESTEINMDPDTMAMMDSHHKNAALAKKMKLMTIRTYQYEKPGMYKMEDVEVFRKKLDDGTWKCSVRVREKNESTDICSRLGPDKETREMVIITAEPKELTFIHMTGNMSLEDLNRAKDGLEHR
jgi:hypothetical protein